MNTPATIGGTSSASPQFHRRDAETPSRQETVIYCKFQSYYWSASGRIGDTEYKTAKRIHGSARQATDEICEQARNAGVIVHSVRRIYSNQYSLSFSASPRLRGEKPNPENPVHPVTTPLAA